MGRLSTQSTNQFDTSSMFGIVRDPPDLQGLCQVPTSQLLLMQTRDESKTQLIQEAVSFSHRQAQLPQLQTLQVYRLPGMLVGQIARQAITRYNSKGRAPRLRFNADAGTRSLKVYTHQLINWVLDLPNKAINKGPATAGLKLLPSSSLGSSNPWPIRGCTG